MVTILDLNNVVWEGLMLQYCIEIYVNYMFSFDKHFNYIMHIFLVELEVTEN